MINTKHWNTESKIKSPQTVSLTDTCIYTVELQISERRIPEVKVAKKAVVKNLEGYETFIEVKDEGQTKFGSRWLITEKEQHNGQKTKVKARLVTREF